jgi:hypothetical protein
MNRIVVDAGNVGELHRQEHFAALCDVTGRIVAYFAPALAPADYEGVDSPASEEELDRRSSEGGGRTLAEIMADLRSYPLD